MERKVEKGMVFMHFKKNMYKVICIAKSSEDQREIVVYESLDKNGRETGKIWTRDKEEFLSLVDKEKYPNVTQKYRFEEIEKYN